MRTHHRLYVGLGAGGWLLIRLTTPTFHLSSVHFFITLHIHLGLPHPTIAHHSQCRCAHTINDLHTHLLQCPCGNEHITTHYTFQDIIETIVLGSEARVQREVSHLFFCRTHPMTNGYLYHKKLLMNFDGHCHC